MSGGRSVLATRRVLPIPAHTLYPMPRYEYRCRACGDTFEVSRAMSEANAQAECPAGHDDTVKLLSTIALTGRGGGCRRRAARGRWWRRRMLRRRVRMRLTDCRADHRRI